MNNYLKLAFDVGVQQALEEIEKLAKKKKKKKKKDSGVATKANPELWEKAKAEAKRKMGGKHSARAMQLATQIYKKKGGKYKGKKATTKNNSMKKWTSQKWQWSSEKAAGHCAAPVKKKKKKDTSSGEGNSQKKYKGKQK